MGFQFTIPAPNELLFRSLVLTITPTALGGTGTLTVTIVDDIDEAVFSATNLPSTQATLPLYSGIHDTSTLTAIPITLNLGVDPLQTGNFVGGTESALQILGHSGFQGNVALIVIHTGALCQFDRSPTLVGDETPFLTGLPTTKRRYSSADFCPRCSRPIFREQLIRDGYTKGLVCSDCWDRDEERYPPYRPPKEINPR